MKICAMLSFHMGIPFPEDLPPKVLATKWQQLKWVLKMEARRYGSDGPVEI